MISTNFFRPFMMGALFAVASTASFAASDADRFGNAVTVSNAQRPVELTPNTRYLNIEQRETVKFVAQGKVFAWNFDTFGTPVFDLAKIAPKDINVGNVKVYMSPDSTYGGGAD